MKEILFATGNESKVNRFKEKLLERGILLKSLKDININLEVEENGKTAIENAEIKVKTYYDATKITTMAMDDSMYMIFQKINNQAYLLEELMEKD